MSSTRSRKKRSMDEADLVEELPPSKRKSKEKSRRRSSFMRGRSRRSLPPANIDISDLHKKIPPDETEEKRLALLHQVCFEYTFNRLEEEMPNAKGFEELKNKARSAFNETLDKLEKEDCLRDSCNAQKHLPNPVNIKIEESANKIQEQLNRLLTEGNKWEELLTSATEMAIQAERLAKDGNSEMKAPDTLSKQDARFLTGLPNLKDILSSTKRSLNKLEIHVDNILTSCRSLKELESSTDAYLTHQIKVIAEKSNTDTDFSPVSLFSGFKHRNEDKKNNEN